MAEAAIKVIKTGMLIDGTGAAPIENATVIIEKTKIKAVGQNIQIPNAAEVIDATGKTVMPGLIDAHMHCSGHKLGDTLRDALSRPIEVRLIKALFDAKDYLAAGFTTVKSCGGINGVFLKRAVDDGILTGVPRIITSGYMLQHPLGILYPFMDAEYIDARTSKLAGLAGGLTLLCDGVDECIKAARYTLGHGADFIKIWSRRNTIFNLDELKVIVQTAAENNKFVTVHAENPKQCRSSVVAGAKTIDHCYGIEDEVIEMGNKAGVIYVSTLIEALATITYGAGAGYSPEEIESCRRNFDNMTQPYKKIRKLGGVMAIGTDSGATTLVRMYSSSAVELELLVKHCDFTPMEAIVAATKNGALASFIGDKTGTIEPGKFADIIIVDGDPLKDIKILQDTNKIKMVMLEGKVEIERSLTPKIV